MKGAGVDTRVPRGKEDMRERSEGGVGAEGQRAHEKAWSVSWSLFFEYVRLVNR